VRSTCSRQVNNANPQPPGRRSPPPPAVVADVGSARVPRREALAVCPQRRGNGRVNVRRKPRCLDPDIAAPREGRPQPKRGDLKSSLGRTPSRFCSARGHLQKSSLPRKGPHRGRVKSYVLRCKPGRVEVPRTKASRCNLTMTGSVAPILTLSSI
jgi:hypothetical protein